MITEIMFMSTEMTKFADLEAFACLFSQPRISSKVSVWYVLQH